MQMLDLIYNVLKCLYPFQFVYFAIEFSIILELYHVSDSFMFSCRKARPKLTFALFIEIFVLSMLG